MQKKWRRFRPSPAMIVAVVALIAALGGTALAGGVLNKKKVKKISANQVNKLAPGLSVASARNADNAGNAANLGGLSAADYQQFCKPGGIKGTLVMSGSQVDALPSDGDFQNVVGFNCAAPGNTTTSVQVRRTAAAGELRVRFVPNPDSGSSIVSPQFYTAQISSLARSDDPKAPGETVFQVVEANSGGTPLANPDVGFSLVIF
jgi:hypothetical protein